MNVQTSDFCISWQYVLYERASSRGAPTLDPRNHYIRFYIQMLELSGIQASIEVDGVELEQYHVQTSSDGSEVTCWIASEEGKVCSDSSPKCERNSN